MHKHPYGCKNIRMDTKTSGCKIIFTDTQICVRIPKHPYGYQNIRVDTKTSIQIQKHPCGWQIICTHCKSSVRIFLCTSSIRQIIQAHNKSSVRLIANHLTDSNSSVRIATHPCGQPIRADSQSRTDSKSSIRIEFIHADSKSRKWIANHPG